MTRHAAPASRARRPIDPITVEVIGNALASIVEEMGETLVRAAYSTNIKERRDCSTCLFDAEGRTLCQAEHIPMHLGSLIGVVDEILERYDIGRRSAKATSSSATTPTPAAARICPTSCSPSRSSSTASWSAWATNLAHHADFVDRGHAHIFQEGLRIPPVRLYREGELQQDVLDLILLNCQVPRERLNDFRAQMAANRQGIAALPGAVPTLRHATCVLAAGDALLDYAERLTRAGIRTIPVRRLHASRTSSTATRSTAS